MDGSLLIAIGLLLATVALLVLLQAANTAIAKRLTRGRNGDVDRRHWGTPTDNYGDGNVADRIGSQITWGGGGGF